MPLFFYTPFFSRLNRSSFKKYKQRAAHNISPIRLTLPCILSHQIIHGAFKAVSILNKITIKTNHFNNYLPVFFSFFFLQFSKQLQIRNLRPKYSHMRASKTITKNKSIAIKKKSHSKRTVEFYIV